MTADIIAGVLSGMLGAMGFGGGGILILYLSLYRNLPQLTAQGINLIFFIPSALLAVIMHSKNHLIEWKTAVKYILFGLIGVGIGFILLKFVNENVVRKLFSVLLIYMGIKELFSKSEN